MALLTEVISQARARTARAERLAVASEIGQLVERSRLSRAAFAERVGTSTSRLSTYLSGKVARRAALMVRMRNLVVPDASHPHRQ